MSLEGIINSNRYELLEEVGRETWGRVYRARDIKLDKEVAIKLIDPTEIARQQMARWQLTLKAAIMKEAEELKACANVVPRKYDEDENDQGFIVMPFYETFFDEVLDAATRRKPHEGSGEILTFKEGTLSSSGLHIEEIIRYTRDIANGIAEVNKVLGRAHCDVKPDNIAVDEDGKLLLNDLGTATYLSMEAGDDAVRDNRGCLYTRSPLMFVDSYNPTRKEDAFSLASLMYKMFTGKYIFEDEINELLVAGGEEAVKEYMNEFIQPGNYFNPNYQTKIRTKLEESEILEEFQDFLLNSFTGWYSEIPRVDGFRTVTRPPTTQDMLEQSITLYRENQAKDKARKELTKEFRKKARNAFLTGTAITTFLLGMAWGIFLLPKVDYTARQDYEANMLFKPAEMSNITFEVEKPIRASWAPTTTEDYSNLMQLHDKSKDDSVTDLIVTAFIRTMQELGHQTVSTADIHKRYIHIKRELGGPRPFIHEQLRELIPHYGTFTRVDERVIDLEDCLATTLLGAQRVRDAQKAVNDMNYHTYVRAKDRAGNLEITSPERTFLDRWIYNSIQVLPLEVCSERD